MTYRATNTVVTEGRWSCPDCPTTVIISANAVDTRWCIRAAMHRHGILHANERKGSE